MTRLFSVVLVVLTLFAAADVQAQPQTPSGRAVLTGVVTDAETGDPLQDVNVFIAESMTGTATDANGRYRIERVPLGAHRLYVSSIGYESAARNLNLREARVYNVDFALQVTVLEEEGVTVEAERDEKWQERYAKFQRLFIGETPNAKQTEIQNPEVLRFDGGVGSLEAYSVEPLVIINRALGYRVEYFLEEFVATPGRTRYNGEPLFSELEGSVDEREQWAEARRRAFYGSFHHLMLAMLANNIEQHGFKLYMRPSSGGNFGSDSGPLGGGSLISGGQRYPTTVDDIMKDGEVATERVLDFNGVAEVIYLGEKETEAYTTWLNEYASSDAIRRNAPKFQTSQFWLERGPATIDYKGDIVDPYGVTVSGFFAFERVADQVPKEYRPQ
ncbi:hypothetical protein CRI94_07710 [Longibacter salinarum]|uniref:Carboxypeptidase-like regulatory domain-containing protein n=1 Tax=Longibacter salinarum TaxID=1850348 RepID=A0A2A8CZ00_9BACT|nr:carboxypeptidase-like regulatory domain-containing protein [Longibacter salinarum]PEN13932.1 hypothetical protein CRI94_07710 [Longibacter salinarum]